MPLVSEPFAQVAIDIIGPLPVCQESGNRFILTVLDLCTHYPEAVLLKQHTAADVVQALALFSVALASLRSSFQIKEVISCLSLCRSS